MSSEIVEPSPGIPGPEDPPVKHSGPETVAPAANPTAGSGPGTSSVDDLGVSLSQASPDPLLGEYQPEPQAAAPPAAGHETGPTPAVATAPQAVGPGVRTAAPGAGVLDGIALDVPPSGEIATVAGRDSGVAAVVSALNLGPATPTAPARATAPSSRSTGAPFAALDLYAPPASKSVPESTKRNRTNPPGGGDDEAEDDDLPPRGSSWKLALLKSYASAVTLGLFYVLWLLWGHRMSRDGAGAESDPFPAADNAADPGHRAGQSRKFAPPPALSADRVATLGQTLRIGSLAVTPLEVTAGPVILKHQVVDSDERHGGDGALMLRLRLENLSSGSILCPLDEAFLRERERGVRDSFIVAGPARHIDMFPLAVTSEWSISGQEFRELGPGESYETNIVTAPGALGLVAPEMSWRIRLRTDVNQTETLGVRFGEKDIRKTHGPSRRDPAPAEELGQ